MVINEVQRQIDGKKIVRLDKDGKYYKRFNKTRQCPGLFFKFLEKHGICAQCTMLGTI